MTTMQRLSFFRFILLITIFLVGFHDVMAHSGHSHGGSRRKGGARGKGLIKAEISEDDTSKVTMDIYGNIGLFMAPDFGNRGLLSADQLGTGGLEPWFYTAWLIPDDPNRFLPATLETQISEADFSYIPIWDPSELSFRIRYRFQPQISALVDFGFTEQKGTLSAGSSWSAMLNQLALKWKPQKVKEFSLRAGHLMDYGKYSMLFGQTPLHNIVYQGLSLNYTKKLNKSKMFSIDLSGGASFIDRVMWRHSDVVEEYITYDLDTIITVDTLTYDTTYEYEYSAGRSGIKGSWEDSRIRSYLYGTFKLQLNEKLLFSLLTGIQGIPEAMTAKLNMYEITKRQKYDKGLGWTVGLEGTFTTKNMEHVLAVVYGIGDIEMGWGKPDYVLYLWPYDSIPGDKTKDVEYFSRKGSSLLNTLYWGSFFKKKFQMDWGVWHAYHNPASNPVSWVNYNKDTIGTHMPDSVVQILFPGYNSASELPDSITIDTEPYSTLRFAIDPSYKIGKYIQVGVRYDRIQFLNPDAHSNTQEWQKDDERKPYIAHPFLLTEHGSGKPLYEPSKWELEPVNVNIISPHIALMIGDVLSLKLTYSHGIYDEKVRRHGEFKKYHSNLTFATNVFYTFSSAGKVAAAPRKISKNEAEAKAIQELARLVREGKIEESWSGISPDSVEKKKFATGKQWVIHFYNDAIEDDEKCDIYIFISLEGNFDSFNHFGE